MGLGFSRSAPCASVSQYLKEVGLTFCHLLGPAVSGLWLVTYFNYTYLPYFLPAPVALLGLLGPGAVFTSGVLTLSMAIGH
jgi:hypothetical protein